MLGRVALPELLRILEDEYGSPKWWPADSPFEVAAGAILTQRTSWKNVEKTLAVLKGRNMLDPFRLAEIDVSSLETMIRRSGFYKQKARYLQSLSRYVCEAWAGDIAKARTRPKAELRSELLDIHGIGDETADAILLYALDIPTFVVDAYTYRLLYRLDLDCSRDYAHVKEMFEDALGLDSGRLAKAHALIVVHSKERCRSRPVCDGCPLAKYCRSESEERKE